MTSYDVTTMSTIIKPYSIKNGSERSGFDDSVRLRIFHKMCGPGPGQDGETCPATDIDLILRNLGMLEVDLHVIAEYNHAIPVALGEYKHEKSREAFPPSLRLTNYQVVGWIANKCEIPFFAYKYAADFSWWRVAPMCGRARAIMATEQTLTAVEYAAHLYSLRGWALPDCVPENLRLHMGIVHRTLQESGISQS